MLYLLFVGLIVLASILMCFIVLIQNSKGGGLASSFASSNQIMGVRKTTDFIEKMTWGLAAAMVVLSILTSYVLPKATVETSVIEQNALKEPIIGRTIRLLREANVSEIYISTNDERFERFGVPLLKHNNLPIINSKEAYIRWQK